MYGGSCKGNDDGDLLLFWDLFALNLDLSDVGLRLINGKKREVCCDVNQISFGNEKNETY